MLNPLKMNQMLQILMGSYPIAQLREPFSAVQYLAERLDLPNLLKLQHPEQDEEWSAMDVCDGTVFVSYTAWFIIFYFQDIS